MASCTWDSRREHRDPPFEGACLRASPEARICSRSSRKDLSRSWGPSMSSHFSGTPCGRNFALQEDQTQLIPSKTQKGKHHVLLHGRLPKTFQLSGFKLCTLDVQSPKVQPHWNKTCLGMAAFSQLKAAEYINADRPHTSHTLGFDQMLTTLVLYCKIVNISVLWVQPSYVLAHMVRRTQSEQLTVSPI